MRAIVFFDGQNLYHLARVVWAPTPPIPGSPYGYPSYDVQKLAQALCNRDSRRVLSQIRFYTGVPSLRASARWHGSWSNKLRCRGSQRIYIYRRRSTPGGQEKERD